jgi:hypothetical protein
MGQPVPIPVHDAEPLSYRNPLVERGIARYGDWPEPAVYCKGHAPCRKSGVWHASVADEHAQASVFNQWHRQAYVQEGQAFPDPQALHLGIAARDVTWRWLGQANTGDPDGVMFISVDEPQVFAVSAAEAQHAEQADANPESAATIDVATTAQTLQQPAASGKPGLLGRLWQRRG